MNIFSNFFNRLFNQVKASPKDEAVLNIPEPKNDTNFQGIVAARVIEIFKHPNADRLRLIKVDVGGKIIEPIVCGAFNFDVNDIVVLALPGSKIAQNIHTNDHQGFVLEKAKIRGIESQGMICAAFELGLANEPGKGIMLLKDDVLPGSQFSSNMLK